MISLTKATMEFTIQISLTMMLEHTFKLRQEWFLVILDYFLEWGVAKGEPLSLWYKNPKMAKWIHAEFLSDPAKFVKDIVCDWSTPQRVSINVFAVKGKDFRNYMGKFKNQYMLMSLTFLMK